MRVVIYGVKYEGEKWHGINKSGVTRIGLKELEQSDHRAYKIKEFGPYFSPWLKGNNFKLLFNNNKIMMYKL